MYGSSSTTQLRYGRTVRPGSNGYTVFDVKKNYPYASNWPTCAEDYEFIANSSLC